MSITFYYAPMSSSSRVHWALDELAVPCEKIRVDLKSGELEKPEFLAMNPNGKVPLLVVDGKPLFESLAILFYLGDRFGVDRGLWPAAGDDSRLDALSWTTWGTTELGSAVVRYLFATSPAVPADQRTAAAAAAARDELRDRLRILDDRLAGRKFVLGDSFSLVDVANASITWWLRSLEFDLGELSNVSEWTTRSMNRPALEAILSGT